MSGYKSQVMGGQREKFVRYSNSLSLSYTGCSDLNIILMCAYSLCRFLLTSSCFHSFFLSGFESQNNEEIKVPRHYNLISLNFA